MLGVIGDIFCGSLNFITAAFISAAGCRLLLRTDILRRLGPGAIKREFLGSRVSRSSITAFMASLGGTVGVGNIIGVGAAVATGGAGSLFWMCVTSFFGMCIKYAEIFSAVKLGEKKKALSELSAAPMDMLSSLGKGGKRAASAFALLGLLSSFCMGAMTQAGAVTETAARYSGNPDSRWLYALLFAAAALFFSLGGTKRLLRAIEKMVPVMCFLYIIACVALIIRRLPVLPGAVAEIFASAFSLKAGAGGLLGAGIVKAVGQGAAKGIFSNEAGLGTGGLAHGFCRDSTPEREGLWGAAEVFIDTAVISGLTGLALVSGGAGGENGVFNVFSASFGRAGGVYVLVSLFVFGLTSVLSWEYYCKCFAAYIYGNRVAVTICAAAAFILCVFFGGVADREQVWRTAEVLNACMALINTAGTVIVFSRVSKSPCLGAAKVKKVIR